MKSRPAVTVVHEFADQQIARLTKLTAEAGRPITCCAGCSACCYEPVYCDSREIEHALASLTTDELDYVQARTAQWIRQVQPSGLLQVELPSAFAWRALKTPCPFLRENLCMIYNRRPASCRTHLAVGDPKNCHDDELRKHQTFAISHEMERNITFVAVAKYKGGNQDHLGVWLARFFGTILQSATRYHVSKSKAKNLKLIYAK